VAVYVVFFDVDSVFDSLRSQLFSNIKAGETIIGVDVPYTIVSKPN
jgi:hypothetical protein